MDFIAVDVETANADLSSICQVGLALFSDNGLVDTWASLINPQDEFDPINTSIHGIDERMVRDAPTWADVHPKIASILKDNIAVSHTAFDRASFSRACERFSLQACECTWLDSARVVRRAWPQFSKSGYGLTNVAVHLGISYRAHDALEDARCAGEVLLRAITETGLEVEQWLTRVQQPVGQAESAGLRRDGNPDGELYGEVLVFTGSLSMVRREAADAAASAGCRIEDSVTKHTTLLVVGNEDVRKLNGQTKSSKHRKAEQLIAAGQAIRIIGEDDFRKIVLQHSAAQAVSV